MMTHTYIIHRYTLGWLVTALLLYGCASDRRENTAAMEKMQYAADSVATVEGPGADTTNEEMMPDTLDPRQIDVFVEIGARKLKDYADYMAIALDHHYNTEFRKQAEEQAMKQFIDDGRNFREQWIDIPALSEELRGHQVKITIDSIVVKDFPKPVAANYYRGTCAFRQTITGTRMTKHYSVITKVNRYSAGIIILKTRKKFGDETREVWEVVLDRFEDLAGSDTAKM